MSQAQPFPFTQAGISARRKRAITRALHFRAQAHNALGWQREDAIAWVRFWRGCASLDKVFLSYLKVRDADKAVSL